jgi:chemotaxis response regulator CheB
LSYEESSGQLIQNMSSIDLHFAPLIKKGLLRDLLIKGYALQIVSPRSGRNKQIDLFLTSLAEAMGARAIAIILSGYDGDDTEGCRRIKAKGGTAFAQDTSAEVDGMPRSAQASGCIDFVLPPEKIPEELQRLASTSKNKGA